VALASEIIHDSRSPFTNAYFFDAIQEGRKPFIFRFFEVRRASLSTGEGENFLNPAKAIAGIERKKAEILKRFARRRQGLRRAPRWSSAFGQATSGLQT
jgi:hypothetical protein